MDRVKPKKRLGQHFLKDRQIAHRIVDTLEGHGSYQQVLEVGPGMGILTEILLQKTGIDLQVSEIDGESVAWLRRHLPLKPGQVIEGDFLAMALPGLFSGPLGLIGNFPYNISSQIFFKVYDNRQLVTEVVGMVQKEVAERIAASPGGKTGGILSILMQAFYDVKLCFSVPPEVFDPPPKVQSAVLQLKRNNRTQLPCNEVLFKKVVKQAFATRRKTLRNALKSMVPDPAMLQQEIFGQRAEQLSVEQFIELTRQLSGK